MSSSPASLPQGRQTTDGSSRIASMPVDGTGLKRVMCSLEKNAVAMLPYEHWKDGRHEEHVGMHVVDTGFKTDVIYWLKNSRC